MPPSCAEHRPPRSGDETLVGLTPADVQALLPRVGPLGPGTDPSAAPQPPWDACGTAPLVGVAVPLHSDSGQWGTSTTRQVGDDGRSGTETTTWVLLEATVDTYADPAHAAALRESTSTCTSRSGAEEPTHPFTAENFVAPALYVSDHQDGVLQITAVVIDGPHVATVHGWVPVAPSSPTPTPDPNSVPQPVPGADPGILLTAVDAVVDLARSAARHGDG